MRKRTVLLLLLIVAGSCSYIGVGMARLTPDVTHVDVKLLEDAAGCKVQYPDKAQAEFGGFVHWPIKANGDKCKFKKIKIANGSGDFKSCPPDSKPVSSPFLKCSDLQDTGDLSGTAHLYCRIDPFAKKGCYKYSFTGDVALDPEIEIDRPRQPLYGWIVYFLSRLRALFV